MRISLVRIPHRQGHSIHRVVRPGQHHGWRKLPYPRTHSSWPKREGSQVARQLGSNNRVESWIVRSPSCLGAIPEFVAPVLPCSWPGRRIGLCCEATRAPSQGPRPNGAARCRPLPFGIGTKALNPPVWATLACPPIRTVAFPLPSLRPPRGPGTRHRSSVCSTCAR
jgi:hypothetical protein